MLDPPTTPSTPPSSFNCSTYPPRPASNSDPPPALPPKLPRPPRPPPISTVNLPFPRSLPSLPSPDDPTPSPIRDSFVVPISTLSPRSSKRAAIKPRPSTSRADVLPRSRTTSVDYSTSRLDLPFAFDHDDPDESRDVDRVVEEEQPMLGGRPPLPSARKRTTAKHSTLRWALVALALAGVLVLLFARSGGAGNANESPEREGQEVHGQDKEQVEGIEKVPLRQDETETFSSAETFPPAEGEFYEQDEERGDGSTVTMEDGSTFVYRNPFGGTFTTSPASLSARPQNDTPSLAEDWDWETMRISGVNLGGWLTVEPFITPSLFEPYLASSPSSPVPPAVDEWTLSMNLLSAGGPELLHSVLEGHYRTFITEKDFADIASAGLNWVRLPVPYWAIKKWEDEPFLEGVAWTYLLKALRWARKYGLRINLDLHSVPGSQNGWNHSGRLGSINFLHGTMGLANAQRALDYIGAVAEFVTREGVKEVVPMFSVLNEPMLSIIGTEALRSFYAETYRLVRNITGFGAGNGPFLAFHDGFKGTHRWYDFSSSRAFHSPSSPGPSLGGMDRVAMDSHRYLAFGEPDLRSLREQVLKPCQKWAPEFNKTFNSFGVALAGEFSLAVTDCGRFLNNVFEGSRLEGTFPNASQPLYPPSAPAGTCEFWEDYESWDDEFKLALQDLAYAQMDTFQNWFYWTWKTTPSLLTPGRAANPLWSYSLGLAQGYIPANPRRARDFCFDYAKRTGALGEMPRRVALKGQGGGARGRVMEMEGWKVGRVEEDEDESGQGDDDDDEEDGEDNDEDDEEEEDDDEEVEIEIYPFPPDAFEGVALVPLPLPVDRLPVYTRTGAGVVLPGPTPTPPPSAGAASTLAGAGAPPPTTTTTNWYTRIQGCEYPDAWDAVGVEAARCTAR